MCVPLEDRLKAAEPRLISGSFTISMSKDFDDHGNFSICEVGAFSEKSILLF